MVMVYIPNVGDYLYIVLVGPYRNRKRFSHDLATVSRVSLSYRPDQ